MITATRPKSEFQTMTKPEMPTIEEIVSQAAEIVSPVWPLKTFIAVNPLQGLENMPFEKAIEESDRFRSLNQQENQGRDAVNRELIKWCTAFFDDGQATIPMPGRSNGFYSTFAELAGFDGQLCKSENDRKWLSALPKSSALAIVYCLDRLAIPKNRWVDFIKQSLMALPGWAGYVKWKECWQNPAENAIHPASIIDFVAVRLILTAILWPESQAAEELKSHKPANLSPLLTAEREFRSGILKQLSDHLSSSHDDSFGRPQAQMVFCIDVRSEPFRRAIEQQKHYETFGFAGFFGLPVRLTTFNQEKAYDSCPVLLKPSHRVAEKPGCNDDLILKRLQFGRNLLKARKLYYQSLKYNFATPFALAEMLGPWFGAMMSVKTFAPKFAARLQNIVSKWLTPEIEVVPELNEIPMAQQANYAEQALRMMGLTSNLAPLVVFCGHGSSTQNNAYATALDCGACGGNHGGANARILAFMLNNPAVREILHERGLVIPSDTWFMAAQHDTTTDDLRLFGLESLPQSHQAGVAQLQQDLHRAKELNSKNRCGKFADTSDEHICGLTETTTRSQDWAQIRPEWGLAGNAGFIVGPRSLTNRIDLHGRCFLHSYDWTADADGKILTTILTAPMVVAQWINSQYLFSTLDHISYGSGSKITHNVTGKIGVMQGNASDLMHGLPMQSVKKTDDENYHQPLRLTTFVYAPRSSIDRIIRNQPKLQTLFGNGWVTLVCIDPENQGFYILDRSFSWERLRAGANHNQPALASA